MVRLALSSNIFTNYLATVTLVEQKDILTPASVEAWYSAEIIHPIRILAPPLSCSISLRFSRPVVAQSFVPNNVLVRYQ